MIKNWTFQIVSASPLLFYLKTTRNSQYGRIPSTT